MITILHEMWTVNKNVGVTKNDQQETAWSNHNLLKQKLKEDTKVGFYFITLMQKPCV